MFTNVAQRNASSSHTTLNSIPSSDSLDVEGREITPSTVNIDGCAPTIQSAPGVTRFRLRSSTSNLDWPPRNGQSRHDWTWPVISATIDTLFVTAFKELGLLHQVGDPARLAIGQANGEGVLALTGSSPDRHPDGEQPAADV